MSMDDLVVGSGVVIPASELAERFEPSGGPGGQHANRSSTRVVLDFDLAGSTAFDAATKAHMSERLGERARGGRVTVVVDESRSQWRNRSLARRRLSDLLTEAMHRPAPRRPTTPSRAAKRRRLLAKRTRADVKRMRRPPDVDS